MLCRNLCWRNPACLWHSAPNSPVDQLRQQNPFFFKAHPWPSILPPYADIWKKQRCSLKYRNKSVHTLLVNSICQRGKGLLSLVGWDVTKVQGYHNTRGAAHRQLNILLIFHCDSGSGNICTAHKFSTDEKRLVIFVKDIHISVSQNHRIMKSQNILSWKGATRITESIVEILS